LRNIKNLKRVLIKLGACGNAIDWVGNRDLLTAFAECPHADWMLWLAGHLAGRKGYPTRPDVVRMACICARSALKYVPKGEKRPLVAIKAAEKWAENPTKENAHAATAAAHAVDAAAYAAHAATYAAHAATAAAYAADAAAYAACAATAAADAADAATYAAYAAAHAATHKKLCGKIREYIKEKS
jgi:hypothetical protein